MVYHFQKRWRLSFRHDPDAGRVWFIGPLVLSLDVVARPRSAYARVAERGFGFLTSTDIDALQSEAYAEGRIDEREEWLPLMVAARSLVAMCEVHGDFKNGVTDSTGSTDEGDVMASQCILSVKLAIHKISGEL